MSDNVQFQTTAATPPSGTVVSTEEVTNLNGAGVSAQHAQRIVLSLRTADNTALDVTSSNPLPISDAGGSLTVDGPLTNAELRASAVSVSITALPNEGQQDAANSISVVIASDQPLLSVLGPLTDAELRATPVPFSVSSLPLPTGAATSVNQSTIIGHLDGVEASLSSIDGKIPASPATAGNQTTGNTLLSSIDSKLVTPKTADFDTGGGTDDVQMQGIALPASGGAVAGGTSTNPIRTDPTGTTTQPVSDGGGSLTVDGTVAATQSGTWTEANSTAIRTAVESVGNAISGNEMQVDVVAALPSGDNSIGRVKLTDGTDVADVLDLTNSNPLTVAIVDGVGSQITSFGGGTQYDEDTASSPADQLTMAGVVRKDSAASLVDTDGDRTQLQVDASGALRVTGGGGGTEYTEDAASPADPTGNQLMARRRDSLSTETTTDGDVTALNSTAKGELYVKHADLLSVAVSGGATASAQSTQTSILSEIRDATLSDDSVFTPGSSRVMAVGAVFDDVTPDSVDEDDAGALRMSANRSLYTQIRDAAGNERGVEVTAANALKVDPSGVTQPVSIAATVQADVTDDATRDLGKVDVASLDQYTPVSGRLPVDGSGVTQPISAAALPLPTGAATLTEQQTQSASLSVLDDWDESDRAKVNPIAGQAGVQGGSGVVNALTQRVTLATDVGLPAGTSNIGDVDIASIAAGDNNIGNVDIASMPNVTLAAGTNTNEMVGDVAEDAALAGNPVRMGMRASTAIPTAMSADGDAVTPWANRNGAQVVTQAPHVGLNSDPWNQEHECAQYTTTQTSAILIDAAAGEKIVVTDIQIQSGGTVAGAVQVYFGTGAYSRGTNRAVFDGEFAPSSTSKPGVIMKGPFVSGANGDDLRVTTSAAINPLTISVWFYRLT